MIDEFDLQVIDATLPLLEQQEIVRGIVEPHIETALKIERSAWKEVLTAESLQGRYLKQMYQRTST